MTKLNIIILLGCLFYLPGYSQITDTLDLGAFNIILVKQDNRIDEESKSDFNLLWTRSKEYPVQRREIVLLILKNEKFFIGLKRSEIAALLGKPDVVHNNSDRYKWEVDSKGNYTGHSSSDLSFVYSNNMVTGIVK